MPILVMFKENRTTPRPSERPPVMGGKMSTMFKLYGCSAGKLYFHILVLNFGHWSVREYVPFRHQISAPNRQ